jgi:predicted DNA-binding mobile mystery protein A
MPQYFNPARDLLIQQIEQRLAPWRSVPRKPPVYGWLRTIRQGLGMSAPQLAQRLGISRQAIADLESREREGAVTLEALSRAAAALDCDLVYAIVPRAELGAVIEAQARARAWDEMKRTAHSMHLEDQAAPTAETERLVRTRAAHLLSKSPRTLWESEAIRKPGSAGARPDTGRDRGSRSD